MRGFGFLFDPESRFGQLMGRIYLVVISNVLFVVFSLPVVTIGASYTALCHVMLKTNKAKGEVKPIREFWFGFKNNFKQATIVWFAAVFFLIFGFLDLFWCSQMGSMAIYLQLPVMTMLVMAIVLLLYLFPTIAAFENKVINLVKHAVYFMMVNPAIAIMIVGVNLIPFSLMILDQVNQPTYVFGYFFFGFGVVTIIAMNLISKVFYAIRLR